MTQKFVNYADWGAGAGHAAGRDLKGRTALHWAATFGHVETVEAEEVEDFFRVFSPKSRNSDVDIIPFF